MARATEISAHTPTLVGSSETLACADTQGSSHEERAWTEPSVTASEDRLGRYLLLRPLGQGGMGVVYLAYDELLNRRVAIKRVRTDARGADAHLRILQEAKALAQLSHPNVVPIFEVSASTGRVFIAMEYIPGCTLRAWTASWRAAGAPQRELLDMFIGAGRGLAAAHACGLVHRDFKPENVLVGTDGRARVVDFGLVTTADAVEQTAPGEPAEDPSEMRLTADGALLGTPAYMSPEQFIAEAADARSDQFSFCVALYEALCGALPFAGDTLAALQRSVSTGELREPPKPLPEWLREILHRGLALRPEDRFPSMDALLARLSHDPLATRQRRRRAAAIAFVSAIAAVLVVVLAARAHGWWQARQGERAAARSLASTEARIAEARADGDPVAAARRFAALVEDPLFGATPLLARAWLHEAARRRDDGDEGAARTAFATAYLRALAPQEQVEALVGLAALFRARFEWDALASLFALLDRDHPEAAPQLAGLRLDVALSRRDFAGARALLVDGKPSVRALAQALTEASETSHRDVASVQAIGDQLVLVPHRDFSRTVHVVARTPRLPTIQDLPAPAGTQQILVLPGEPLTILGYGDDHTPRSTLYRVDPGGLVPTMHWDEDYPSAATAVDLDEDGVRELYVANGTGLELISMTPQADGSWQRRVVYTSTDTLFSAAEALVPMDLDGDGRDELVAGFTGWRAFDVRVLRFDPATRMLRSVARDKLGTVVGLAPLPGPAGTRRLVVKNVHASANSLVFAPDRPYGEPEGLYIYGLEGARLVRQTMHQPAMPAGASLSSYGNLGVGDVNGDGRVDLAADALVGDQLHTLLFLQEDDGEFSPVVLGSLRFLGFVQLDDDPADEVLVNIVGEAGEQRLWVLGAGTDTLAPLATLPPASLPVELADDPAWRRTWVHAAALQGLGLLDDAAVAFAQLGRDTQELSARALAYYTAGLLRERSGDVRGALVLLRDAAQAPEFAVDAGVGAMRAELRIGDYEGATRTIEALRAAPALDPKLRGELDRRWAPLAKAGQARVDVDFARPLASAWEIADPLALGQRTGTHGLAVATAAPAVLASLPIEWSGEMIELSAEFTLDETEWGSLLEFLIVSEDDPDATPLVSLIVGTFGTSRGGVDVRRALSCTAVGQRLSEEATESAPRWTDDSVRLSTRVSLVPALGEVGCEWSTPGHTDTSSLRQSLTGPLPPAGRYRLILRANRDGPAYLTATLHHLTVRGVRLRDDSPPEIARAILTRALVRGDPVAALAAFAALGPLSPREQVWRAYTLLQVGRVSEARALLAALLAAPEPVESALLSLLRAQPGLLGPLLRELDPDRFLALTHALWRNTAVNHLADPRARDALLAVLGSLDLPLLLAQARDPGDRARLCDLLAWRAGAYRHAREPARARADLQLALKSAAGLPPGSPQATAQWQRWLDLASLAAADGDLAAAREAVRQARADSDVPLLVDDVVRARAELAALAD